MHLWRNFITGLVAVLTASQSARRYDYPYGNSADGLLADWRKIARDIKHVQGKLKAEAHDGRKKQK